MNSNNSHYFTNNFYINNVDRVIVPSPHHPLMKHPKDEVCVEDIMNLCHKNFRNILPNKINYNFDSKTFLFPFEKNQIIELVNQIDTCIQLLIQNLLLCPNPEIQIKTYNLLVERFSKKELFYGDFLKQMPKFKISLATFKPPFSGKTLNLMEDSDSLLKTDSCVAPNKMPLFFTTTPETSVFHSPLLAFRDKFMEIMNRNLSKENIIDVLQEFTPFVNKLWIPIFNVSTNPASRSKFSVIDDNLLLIGIKKYGPKDIDKIQKNYLQEKKNSEIRNRYKNLICTRAPDNPIKKWKHLQIASLTDEEKESLINGFKWYGSMQKIHVISKYFLPERSASFLEDELNNSEKLLKKRKKYGLSSNPKDQEFFQSIRDYCAKIELQSLNVLEQTLSKPEKIDMEFEQEDENMPKKTFSFTSEKNYSSFSNGLPLLTDKEKSNKGLKKSILADKMELEREEYNYENYNFLNFDKASLSGGEAEEGVEIFIDSKNNKTYKFVDEMTFECDEI